MNRRIVGVLVALITLCLFGVLLSSNGLTKAFNSFYVSDEEWLSIIESRSENQELDISSLKFNGYPLSIAGNTAYYSIVENDSHDLNPLVSFSTTYQLAVHGEQISQDSIERNRSIEFVIYNKNEFRKFELVSTTLPILNMTFDNASGEAPSTREDESFHMSLFDNRSKAIQRVIQSDGQAHRRGNVSFGAQKPNLSLKLTQESVGENTRSNPQELLGMQMNDNWILSGMYYDYEKVRDAFAAKLWSNLNENSFNVANDYEFRYVEVIMNGDYCGLYLLGTKPSPNSILSEVPDEEHPDIMFKIEEGDDIGSFITRQTNILKYYKQETDVDDKIATEVLREYFESIFGDDNLAIESSVDMQNAVDFHLFTNFSQNLDIPRGGLAGYKNCYISFKWDGEKYRAIFTPWDFDIALGTNNLFGTYYDLSPDLNTVLDNDSIAALRRNGSGSADRLIQTRYFTLRQAALSNSKIDTLIDELEKDIYNSGAFRRNMERWTESKHGDPEIKLNDFRTHIHKRLEYLDSYYALGDSESLKEAYFEVPNFVTEYLNTGVLLSPDDPNYYTKQEPVVNEGGLELEPVFWQ